VSRFDLETERRAIEVDAVKPVRIVVVDGDPDEPDLPAGLRLVLCGHCGVRLTLYDPSSDRISMDRWTIKGWTWTPDRGHKQARQPQGVALAVATGSWQRGDSRQIAVFPVSVATGWRRPNLPAILFCYRCELLNGLTTLEPTR
jgi:hypothetical protein